MYPVLSLGSLVRTLIALACYNNSIIPAAKHATGVSTVVGHRVASMCPEHSPPEIRSSSPLGIERCCWLGGGTGGCFLFRKLAAPGCSCDWSVSGFSPRRNNAMPRGVPPAVAAGLAVKEQHEGEELRRDLAQLAEFGEFRLASREGSTALRRTAAHASNHLGRRATCGIACEPHRWSCPSPRSPPPLLELALAAESNGDDAVYAELHEVLADAPWNPAPRDDMLRKKACDEKNKIKHTHTHTHTHTYTHTDGRHVATLPGAPGGLGLQSADCRGARTSTPLCVQILESEAGHGAHCLAEAIGWGDDVTVIARVGGRE